MDWPYPFSAIKSADEKAACESELRLELKPGHPLFEIPITAIGRGDRDDFLLQLQDGSGRVAEVHLTWAGDCEKPPWPTSQIFDSFECWANSIRNEFPNDQAWL